MSESSKPAPRVYTKTGDRGQTSLVSGNRVSKSHLRLEAYGTVDELNSMLGVTMTHLDKDFAKLKGTFHSLQNELFNLGSHLACDEDSARETLPKVNEEHVAHLEKVMDEMFEVLPPLRQFILPGGHPGAAHLQLARTICRRAERASVRLQESGEIWKNTV